MPILAESREPERNPRPTPHSSPSRWSGGAALLALVVAGGLVASRSGRNAQTSIENPINGVGPAPTPTRDPDMYLSVAPRDSLSKEEKEERARVKWESALDKKFQTAISKTPGMKGATVSLNAYMLEGKDALVGFVRLKGTLSNPAQKELAKSIARKSTGINTIDTSQLKMPVAGSKKPG